MGKHTPGPWTLDERYDIPGIVGADGFEVAELPALCISPAWREANPDKHWGNDEASHIDRTDEEHDANARLIAAAPDMLEALHGGRGAQPMAMVANLEWYATEIEKAGFTIQGLSPSVIPHVLRAYAENIRNAIEKADPSPCPTCNGSGEVTEAHESYAVETLGCPHWRRQRKERAMRIPIEEWKWFGNAAHFIRGRWCRFHLATVVGPYLVSTVGEYVHPMHSKGSEQVESAWLKENWPGAEIGYQRKYETMVFKAGEPCNAEGCGCGLPKIASGELTMRGYNDAKSATEGHYELCHACARGEIELEAQS